ncbi:MAG: DegT/DnrJ/EryC1/StrS family aminotransferase, partial [Lactobacillales bacterium]|nr:DegT/DnrJ/EryC1/StrS family aminotransferase [Lactobacillales bacterium]
TRAIIPVDIGGVMCDYKQILNIVNQKKSIFSPKTEMPGTLGMQSALGRILILSDAAHSFGAKRDEFISGSAADFTCFSFHAVKNLTTAEGGALTWKNIPAISDESIYRYFMLLSLHGQSKDALEKTKLGTWDYDIKFPGFKCNMTDIMASLGLVQLKRYPLLQKRRHEIIERYNNALKNANISTLNHYSSSYKSSGHLYCVRLIGKDETFRNSVIDEMSKHGISTNVHYKPLPMHTAYKNLGFKIEDFPNAYNLYRNEITLPLHTLLSDPQIDYIANTLIKLIARTY